MHHVTIGEVQQWFENTKLAITEIDDELEKTVTALVFADLADRYDVSLWTDDVMTPEIVRKVISIYYAAFLYQRTYSDDQDTSNYGSWLFNFAKMGLLGLSTGASDIPGVDRVGDEVMTNDDHWPNDSTGDPKFAMDAMY